MSDAIVAKRYADALFQLAKDKNKLETIREELKIVRDVFGQNPKLQEVLFHPRIKHQDKVALINDAFNTCDEDIIHTIKLLTERRRIQYIAEVAAYFTDNYNAAKGIAEATAYSVRELTENEQAEVNAALAKQLDKQKVVVNNEVDPSILGGLKVRVGNTIYDGSVKGKLERVKNNLVSISK